MPSPKRIRLDPGVFSSSWYPHTSRLETRYFTKYLHDENKPFFQLESALKNKHNNPKLPNGKYVVHLLLRDFRLHDSPALEAAAARANSLKVPLLVVYPFCEENLKSHGVSAWQLKYQYNVLELLKQELAAKNVPLVALRIEHKRDLFDSISAFLNTHEVTHVYANIEYEVDELRLFLQMASSKDFDFNPFHHSCLVKPTSVATQKGTQYSVFTPWYKSWMAFIKSHRDILHPSPVPTFETNKVADLEQFEDKKYNLGKFPWPFTQESYFDSNYRISSLTEPLDKFKSELSLIEKYDDERNRIAENNSSRMSHHLALGVVTTRDLVNILIESKLVSSVDSGNKHAVSYIRELAWRDFYKHILCNWPHVCMHRPFQLDYVDVQWETNHQHLESWCAGKTGFPVVDASMRQLVQTGYMNNRCRMVVASFFAKNLLLDWRLGEDFFVRNLIDGDFASNNGGWGFSASVGVDPQPYFRVFNPYLQSEKFDKEGTFIRKWVPELRDIHDKHIHNPYGNPASKKIAESNGYPSPIVDYKVTRQVAIDRFKEAR